MAKAKKYMRIGDPTVTRNLSVKEGFARENGWIPYDEPEQVEPVDAPNLDQVEKPDKPNTPLKPKAKARK